MQNFDWIVVGAGITGSALSYELAKKGLKVLLLEKDPTYDNATRIVMGELLIGQEQMMIRFNYVKKVEKFIITYQKNWEKIPILENWI